MIGQIDSAGFVSISMEMVCCMWFGASRCTMISGVNVARPQDSLDCCFIGYDIGEFHNCCKTL